MTFNYYSQDLDKNKIYINRNSKEILECISTKYYIYISTKDSPFIKITYQHNEKSKSVSYEAKWNHIFNFTDILPKNNIARLFVILTSGQFTLSGNKNKLLLRIHDDIDDRVVYDIELEEAQQKCIQLQNDIKISN